MKRMLICLLAGMFLAQPLLAMAAENGTPVPARTATKAVKPVKKRKHKLSKAEEAARNTGMSIKAANAHHGSTKVDPRSTPGATSKP